MQTQPNYQDRIIEAAFEEWGKTNYTNTSLSPISRRLGLTKPALYRHFPSKNALIAAMERRFLADYTEMHRRYNERAAGTGPEEAVRLFVDFHFRFFFEHKYYYIFFLMQMLRTPLGARPEIQKVMADEMLLFKKLFIDRGRRTAPEELFARLHYLFVASIYRTSRSFIDCATGFAVVPNLSEPEIAAEISRTSEFCLRGLMKDPRPQAVDYAALEEKCAVRKDEMPPPDRIFSAVENVVADVGLRDASIDKIAARIGMSKSSLYFYFKNKDDLFRRMMERERLHVAKIFKERFAGLAGFPAESFCFMVFTATYTLNNPALLTVFNWLRFQNIAMTVAPPEASYMRDIFSFVYEAHERGDLNGSESDLLQAATLLHVAAFRIVMDMRNLGKNCETIMNHLRVFHKLYLYGFLARDLYPREIV